MTTHKHHKEIMDGIAKQFSEILKNSDQSIYIYLDDEHKICNKKFASLLGYSSETEWANTKGSFPQLFVSNKSQRTLIEAFGNAMENGVGSNIKINWKKKSGEEVSTSVILVPIAFEGHLLALHFID